MQILPRPCDRCKAGVIEDNYSFTESSETIYDPHCHETQMSNDIIAWLCVDCRMAWFREVWTSPLFKQFDIANFELEFWKTTVGPQSTDLDLQKGLALLGTTKDLSQKLNNLADSWLKSI